MGMGRRITKVPAAPMLTASRCFSCSASVVGRKVLCPPTLTPLRRTTSATRFLLLSPLETDPCGRPNEGQESMHWDRRRRGRRPVRAPDTMSSAAGRDVPDRRGDRESTSRISHTVLLKSFPRSPHEGGSLNRIEVVDQGTRMNRIALPLCSNVSDVISPAPPSNTTLAGCVMTGMNVRSPVGIKNTPGASSGNASNRPS